MLSSDHQGVHIGRKVTPCMPRSSYLLHHNINHITWCKGEGRLYACAQADRRGAGRPAGGYSTRECQRRRRWAVQETRASNPAGSTPSSNSRSFGVCSGRTRTPSKRNRTALLSRPCRWQYESMTFFRSVVWLNHAKGRQASVQGFDADATHISDFEVHFSAVLCFHHNIQLS